MSITADSDVGYWMDYMAGEPASTRGFPVSSSRTATRVRSFCSFIERGPNVDGSQPIPNMALKNEKQKLDVNGSVVENNESPPAPTSAFIG